MDKLGGTAIIPRMFGPVEAIAAAIRDRSAVPAVGWPLTRWRRALTPRLLPGPRLSSDGLPIVAGPASGAGPMRPADGGRLKAIQSFSYESAGAMVSWGHVEEMRVLLRPFSWDDLPTIVDLINRSDGADGLERGTSEQLLRSQWASPGVDPTRHAFLVEAEGDPVGFGRVDLRPGDDETGFSKVQCFGRVLPAWRDRGIGTRIMSECERRALERLDEATTEVVYLEASADQRQHDVAELLAAFGLRPARYFFDMMHQGGPLPRNPDLPAGYVSRTFAWGEDEEATWRVLDTSFRDHWGHTPFSYEHWLHWIRTGPFEADLVVLVEDPDGEVVGVCLCLIDRETNARRGREEGWIDALGVLKEQRRQGIGRSLLIEGMQRLRRSGCTHLLLGVDTENPTGALGLYESVGFEKWKVEVTYQKRLRG